MTERRALGPRGPLSAHADSRTSFVDLSMQANEQNYGVYAGLQPRPIGGILNKWQPARSGEKRNVANASDIEFVTNVAVFRLAERSPTSPSSPAFVPVRMTEEGPTKCNPMMEIVLTNGEPRVLRPTPFG